MANGTDTQTPPTAQPTAPNVPSAATPIGPPPGNLSIDDLANKIKAKYPAYNAMNNTELVRRVVKTYPMYQPHLNQDAIQDLARTSFTGPPAQYLPGRRFGMEVAKGMGLDAERIKAAEDQHGQIAAIHEIGTQVLHGLKGLMYDPLMPITGTASNFEQAVRSGSPGQIVGALASILGGAEGMEKGEGVARGAGRVTSDVAGKARESVGARIHTPEGTLTPGAQSMSEAVGTAAGGAAGGVMGGPVGIYVGGKAGGLAGPSLMERMFPEPATAKAMREQAAAYQARAEDLMRRGEEQEKLDRKAASQARAEEVKTERARKATTARQPLGPEAPAPELGSPENPGWVVKLPGRMPRTEPPVVEVRNSPFAGMQSTTPSAVAAIHERALPQGQPSPFAGAVSTSEVGGAKPAPTMVTKFEKPGPSRIVSPESAPPARGVTYQSLKAPDLLKLVRKGDRLAIREWGRRGLSLPPNVGFMVEQGPTRALGGRE